MLRLPALLAVVAVAVASVVAAPRSQQESALHGVVLRQVARYPRMKPQDLYKLIFQAAMGSRHAGLDSAMAREWLEREVASLGPGPEEPVIDTISADGRLARVNLRPYLAAGGSRAALVAAFVETARAFVGTTAELERHLASVERMAGARAIPFRRDALHAYFERMRTQGFPAVEHSAAYEAAYRPAYRVVLVSLLTASVGTDRR